MGFWIFMLAMELLIPLTMIGFGRRFLRKPPQEINDLFGYRTARSMKNRDTWEFAHRHSGRVWRRAGLALLVLSLAVMLCVFGRGTETVAAVGGVLSGVQVLALFLSIIPTERALRKTFDEYGRRR